MNYDNNNYNYNLSDEFCCINDNYDNDLADAYTITSEQFISNNYNDYHEDEEVPLTREQTEDYFSICITKCIEGFNTTILSWQPGSFSDEFIECNQELENLQCKISYFLSHVNENSNSIKYNLFRKRCDSRVPLITFGIVINSFVEINYCGEDMREWQKALLLEVADFFVKIAFRELKYYKSDLRYPPFLNSPLVTQPTGNGKTFAGLITAICMMIRTRGDNLQLLSPRNGHAFWCVPTAILVEDIANSFKKIIITESFKLLIPKLLKTVSNEKIQQQFVTVGCGPTKPDVVNKMFCIMTYEYARTQLTSVIFDDAGLPKAHRPPLLTSSRVCIIDEAHYIVAGGDRALVADNILLSCESFSIPVLFLTATPSEQFLQFVDTLKLPENLNTTNFPICLDNLKKNNSRKYRIYGNIVVVPKSYSSTYDTSYTNKKSHINKSNKLIVYRALVESIFNMDNNTHRSLLFIQSTKQVQLLAAFSCGLLVAISCNGQLSNVVGALENYSKEYEEQKEMYEKRFDLKKIDKTILKECFIEGIYSVIEKFNEGILNYNVRQSFNYDNFIHFMCFSNHIVPYFSNMWLDTGAGKMIRDMVIGSTANYSLLITTSVVLEGVNIEGAEQIFITADGYSLLTNTQYTQLMGRVGRRKDGYVESWMYNLGDNDNFTSLNVFKQSCIINSKEGCEVCRIIESDDLIDRIIFANNLLMRINNSNDSVFQESLKRVSPNRVTNNYYRGNFRPKLASFFVPASVDSRLYSLELIPITYNNSSAIITLTNYILQDYFNRFNNKVYNIFFNIYNNVVSNLSTPRVMLDTVAFVDYYLQYTSARNMDNSCNYEIIPTALFVPLFSQYSFAFDFNNAHFDLLSSSYRLELSNMGIIIDQINNRKNDKDKIISIFSSIHSGQLLEDKDLQNIESATEVFFSSLLINPSLWLDIFRVSFADALAFVTTYLFTLRTILTELRIYNNHDNLNGGNFNNNHYQQSAEFTINLVSNIIQDVGQHMIKFMNSENPAHISNPIPVELSRNRNITLNLSYLQFAKLASNVSPDESDLKVIVSEYLLSAPTTINTYITNSSYQNDKEYFNEIINEEDDRYY